MELENILFPTGSDIQSESTFSKKKYNMNKQNLILLFLGNLFIKF